MSSSVASEGVAPDHGLSKVRLLVLRAFYAFIVGGQLLFIWPAFVSQLPAPAHYHGIVMTMLAAFSILCAMGILHPLKFLPLLLWELLWKVMWLGLIALPRWSTGTMDPATTQTMIDCSVGALLLLVVPWSYVVRQYVRAPIERSRSAGQPAAAA